LSVSGIMAEAWAKTPELVCFEMIFPVVRGLVLRCGSFFVLPRRRAIAI
jgi:hypothetical protein